MTKIALAIEYDGSNYSGWQRQKHCMSVQEQLERALGVVADENIVLTASGRTDAGVHAWQQCAHFESDRQRDLKAWVMGVNSHLPTDIAVRSAIPVSDDFHSRYDANHRTYRYLILNRQSRSALFYQRVAIVYPRLDTDAMNNAARCLVGEHDFSAFRAAGCQARHARREIFSVSIQRKNDWVTIQVSGNAFLHNMVRIIVGSLVRVGTGQESVDWMNHVLVSRDRKLAGATAVACGLYFMGPRYAPRFRIPDWRDNLPMELG